MDVLFKDITVITMDGISPVKTNTCVGVKDGKISYIGEYKPDFSPKRVINGTDKVLIPGLYNCHSHTPMSLLRGYANDLNLQDWLFNHIFPAEAKITGEMVYTGALLSIAEMIASGTISYTDMYFRIDMIAKAACESGVKVNLSNAIVALDNPDYVYERDNCYSETLHVIENYHGKFGGRIIADAGIHAEYTSYPKAWHQVVDFAGKNNLNLQVHLSETMFEHYECVKKYEKTPARILSENGVFDVPATAAHCVWVTDEDIEILAAKNVTATHCPVSNLKLACGIAPVEKMLKKGVNVAFGTDGVASNNSTDLFEEIKLGCILQKAITSDPTVVPAVQALKMATVNGAKAQGRAHCGMIKEGFDADIVMLDFHSPRQTVCYDPLAHTVYSVTGRDVALTMCQGKILYENGEYKTIDVEKVMFDANNYAKILK